MRSREVGGKGVHDEGKKWKERKSMMRMGSTVKVKGVKDEFGKSGGKRSQ